MLLWGSRIENAKIMKKQFIAGAKCPKCGTQDVIQQITQADGVKHWQCVDCDFTADTKTLPTAMEAKDVTVQTVQIQPIKK